jgi:hypothetical protein
MAETTQVIFPARPWLEVDHEDRSAAGRLPGALDPGFHCVTTHWIKGFMAFQLVRRTRTVLLMVSRDPSPDSRHEAAGPGPVVKRYRPPAT